MSSIRIISCSLAALMAAVCSIPVSAQVEEETVVVEEVVSGAPAETTEGFNALKYTLQKPNRNQFFRNKMFGDHYFVSIEGGGGLFMDPDNLFSSSTLDYRFGVSFGDWVTPVYGWRLGLNAGRHHLDGHHSAFGGASLDWLVNFSSLLRGYNVNRKFEVIATPGIEYQLSRHCHHSNSIFGLRFGLQGRWNFARNLYAYVEPRIGLYYGNGIYRNIENPSGFHYRIEPSLMVGLGFRRMTAEEREKWTEPFETQNAADHMFYEIGAGWTNLKKHNGKSGMFTDNNLTFSFSGGKWFSPYSAIRFNASYGKIYHPREFFMGGVDYMWNLTNAINGYRVYSPFELDLFAGVCGMYVKEAYAKLYPGVEAGLKAMVNINPNWGIFIEPQGRIMLRGFRQDIYDSKVLSSINIGLRYSIGDYKYNYAENLARFKEADDKHQFVTLSFGPGKYKKNYGIGYTLEAGYGRWFSPMSAWKVGVDAQIFPHDNENLKNISVGGDYILSVSSALAGYDPDRFFDFSGSLGAYIGVANSKPSYGSEETTRFTASFKASFIASFKVAQNWSVNVQTQSIAGALPVSEGAMEFRPEMRLMFGTKYEF